VWEGHRGSQQEPPPRNPTLLWLEAQLQTLHSEGAVNHSSTPYGLLSSSVEWDNNSGII
jgi:hypothetical protein